MKNVFILFIALVSAGFLTAQNVGVNQDNPTSTLDVNGSLSVGAAYSGGQAAPANSLVVERFVGIGTSTPGRPLQVNVRNGEFTIPDFTIAPNKNLLLATFESRVAAPQIRLEGFAPGFIDFGVDSFETFFIEESDNARFLLKQGGVIGIGETNDIATLNVRSRNSELIGFRVEDPSGTPDFQVSNNGRVGINQWWTNVTLNIRAGKGGAGNTGGVFRVEDTVGGVLLLVDQLGNTAVTGNISKGGGSFKIDHPLDPENQYLYHSFVESPDMMNVYNDNITTDANGLATVTLPDYFETLNRDFRYQLTVIGTFAQAIIKEKVEGNRFVIQTSEPNVEVSWQVTGIRQDAYANKNRIPNAVEKADKDKGKYLHPEAFGQPKEKQIGLKNE